MIDGSKPPADGAALADELRRLLAETNDQRRRFGQTFWHLYRSLVFWGEHGHSFARTVQLAAPAGAALFQSMAVSLVDLEPKRPDRALRRFARDVLERLAADLDGGDRLRVAYLRFLEGRFPALTELMRAESPETRLFDHDLAAELAQGFAAISTVSADAVPARVRHLADAISESAGGPRES